MRHDFPTGNVTTYGFDAASRLTALDLDLDGAATANDLAFDFAHNPASQIVGEDNANDAYDWTEPSAFTDNYTVNYLNQYLTAAGATIAHDARGNISSDGTTSFAYDALNRLTSVSGGASAALAYDPASRLYEVAGAATTRFLYDGADIIAEYEPGSGSGSGGEDALLRRYVHGPGADEALVWLEGTDTSDRRFLIADARGTIVAITNASGATTNKNLYDAYGTPHASNAGRFQYTGQIWLAEAGLYHYKARAYSPMLGRFLQTDPIGYGDGMNMYAYAGNDPVNFTDPSGTDGVLLCADNPSCDIIWVNASAADRHAYYSSTYSYRRRAARARADLYSKIEDFGFDLSDYPGIAESATVLYNSSPRDSFFTPASFDPGGKSQNQRPDTELQHLTDEELAERKKAAKAHGDKKEVKRIEREEKVRGTRNKQKRGKKPVAPSPRTPFLLFFMPPGFDLNRDGCPDDAIDVDGDGDVDPCSV